jgi:uncharacterized protein YacL
MIRQFISRIAAACVLGLIGWPLGLIFGDKVSEIGFLPWGLVFTLFGATLGAFLAPYLILAPARWVIQRVEAIAFASLIMGIVGLLVGLAAAALFSTSLGRIPGTAGWILPVIVSLVMGTLGAGIMIMRGEYLVGLLPALSKTKFVNNNRNRIILLDTSAIIDGRVAEVVESGFIPGALGVPRFILDELRHVADSKDTIRRNRGRRGLEILDRLRKNTSAALQFIDGDNQDRQEADARLVSVARQMDAYILTTDYNLNRVAAIQGVKVLNVNELANAVRAVALPGEEMTVKVIQEGKESGQGVAFLEDGTMLVIEGGKRYLHNKLDVAVTRVLQTDAGRIIFAQPKNGK